MRELREAADQQPGASLVLTTGDGVIASALTARDTRVLALQGDGCDSHRAHLLAMAFFGTGSFERGDQVSDGITVFRELLAGESKA